MTHYIDSFPGREITIGGRKHLYFGGTSYLGLQTDAAFQNIFIQNVKKYGTNYGASRKSNVRISIFDKTERHFAKLVGSEVCTTLSSGYLAAQLVVQTLNTPSHRFYYAPNTHAALYLAEPKPYSSFSDLNNAVRDQLISKDGATPVVFIDSIDFSVNNYPNFNELRSLPLEELILIVDDSHGIGIVGENGSGVYDRVKELSPKELIVCCSLGKGFGVQAGAVFGTRQRISQLTDTAFFSGASPASPAGMATLFEGYEIFKAKRALLQKNIRLFLERLTNTELLKFMPDYPAFIFTDVKLADYLKEHRIITTNFKYPNEYSPLVSRIVLTAGHTTKDIEVLTELINSY